MIPDVNDFRRVDELVLCFQNRMTVSCLVMGFVVKVTSGAFLLWDIHVK